MAFTRYNSPAEYKPANTYVPIPFEELLTAGMMRDKQYNENESVSDQFYAGMKDINVHAADQDLYQEKIGELDKQMQETLKNNPDVGSYEFKRNLDQIISAQSREPAWRQMKYNLAKATELEKAYKEAKSKGNTPANLAEMEDELQRFYKEGSKGVGFLKDVSPSAYVDYAEPLAELGRGFLKKGNYTGMYDENFNLKTTKGAEGVPVEEVAAIYGYGLDRKTGGLKFSSIPTAFLFSDAGNQLQRDARYISKTSGEPFEKILNTLYQQKTAPLVSKYSGVTTKYDQDVTSLGLSRADNPYAGFESTGKATGLNLKDGRKITGTVEGWEPTWIGKQLRSGLSLLAKGIFGVQGGEGYSDERIEKFVNAVTGAGGADESNYDFKVLKKQLVLERPELANNPRELQKAIVEKIDDFAKQGVEFKLSLPSPNDKEAVAVLNRQASLFFGGAADNGKIEADKISGQAIQRKVYDPTEPESETTLAELASKGQSIQYVGKLKNDNPYAPGLHEIMIDSKPYFIEGDEEQTLRNSFDWGLYDYKRHPSGVGDWMPGDNGMEVRSHRRINPKTKEKEVFLQYKKEGAPDSQAKTTPAVPEGTELFPYFKEQIINKKD